MVPSPWQNQVKLVPSSWQTTLVCPEFTSSAGEEVVELVAGFGLHLDPWQKLVLHHALGENDDFRWAATQIGLVSPRQGGKSCLLEARIIAALLLFEEPLTIYSAHAFSTALEIFRRTELWIANSAEAHRIKRVSHSHGEEGIEMMNGCRVLFRTRTKFGGKGLSGDCVLLDEAMDLSFESMGALLPTMAARPNPSLWYVGTAVDENIHPNGYVLSSVRNRALDGTDPGLCYLEWSAEEGDDPADPQTWQKCNPALGYRITEEFIAAEHRALKHSPKTFATERLCIGAWPTLVDAAQPPIPADAWESLANPTPDLAGPNPRVIAVDKSPVSKKWAIAGAVHDRDGDRIHVEIGWAGTGAPTEIAERVFAVVQDADPVSVIIDARSPAALLKPLLAQLSVEATMTNTTDIAVAADGFSEAVAAGQISHTGQQLLADAIAAATKRELPGGGRFAWGAQPGTDTRSHSWTPAPRAAMIATSPPVNPTATSCRAPSEPL